jgi:hypothetical protein
MLPLASPAALQQASCKRVTTTEAACVVKSGQQYHVLRNPDSSTTCKHAQNALQSMPHVLQYDTVLCGFKPSAAEQHWHNQAVTNKR